MKDDRLHIKCRCGCSAIEICDLSFEDEAFDQICISIWKPCFYTFQGGLFSSIWQRIKIAMKVIFKGEYFLYDIILEKEDIIKLHDYMAKYRGDK